ncbi:hypothetical protein [Noviherbaspirillum aridicola]|uniref:Uncharacterized protein n=1 Tax=Noviherbaspirillum aridicola TaxID=2849687 RepID=A0ABQ4PYS3_9BURK|nr:hypothetical protein [Noviherbaspirillum aridicola]GIZ50052.1 hypothetical protein NCCP691_00660 [Noviherbaspirillum aridicola]
MHTTSPAYGTRYIIRAREAGLLTALLGRLQADPSIQLLDVIGPAGAPHTAVVGLSPEMAAALEMQFRASNQFTIEPDRPLSLFGGT